MFCKCFSLSFLTLKIVTVSFPSLLASLRCSHFSFYRWWFLVIVGISQVHVSSRLDTAGLILEIIKEAWLSLTVWELCNACECLEGGLCFWQENAEIACFIAPLSVKPKAAGRMFVPPVWGSVFNKQKGEEMATFSWTWSAQNTVSSVEVPHLVSKTGSLSFCDVPFVFVLPGTWHPVIWHES